MVVFQNTPEYEARRALMISFQNQLEASLSSALIAAINSRDTSLCRNYYSIFANIQRDSEFRASGLRVQKHINRFTSITVYM